MGILALYFWHIDVVLDCNLSAHFATLYFP